MIVRSAVESNSVICNPNVTHKAVLTWTVQNGIPNGDPESSGGSRICDDGKALVTGVCLSRRWRDYITAKYRDSSDKTKHILLLRTPEVTRIMEGFVSTLDKGDKGDAKVSQKLAKVLEEKKQILSQLEGDSTSDPKVIKKAQAAVSKAEADVAAGPGPRFRQRKEYAEFLNVRSESDFVKTCLDVRLLGGVVGSTSSDLEEDDKAGKSKFQITGPVQIQMVKSEEPVVENDIQIVSLSTEDGTKQTFGRKKFIESATFKQRVIYSGHRGKDAGVTESDMADLWEGLLNCIEFKPSSMRGVQFAISLEIASYRNDLGQGPVTKTVLMNDDYWPL